jgi:hypothetical protein
MIHMSISWPFGDRSTATSLQFRACLLRQNCAGRMTHYVCIAAGLLPAGASSEERRNCGIDGAPSEEQPRK